MLYFQSFCTKAHGTVLAMSAALAMNEGCQLDIVTWDSRYALDVIGAAGLGKDFGSIHNLNNPLAKTYNAVFSVSRQQRLKFLLRGFSLGGW